MWVLTICAAISWGGCGALHQMDMPDKKTCFESLREMRTNDQFIAESKNKRSLFAYCKPKLVGNDPIK